MPSRCSTHGWTVTTLRSLAWLKAPVTVPPSASSSRFLVVAWTSVRLPAVASSIAACGADPHRVDRFRAVMQRDLVLRCLGQEEPGVEALRREDRRDPVRERRHQVGRDLEVLGLHQIDDARLVLGELGAPALLDALEIGGGDQGALAALARQQDAALLERLAHAGDAELELVGRDLVGAGAACAQPRIAVGVLELAAGEHQRAGEGVDLRGGAPP